METLEYYFHYLDAAFAGMPLIISVTVILVLLLLGVSVFCLSRTLFLNYKDGQNLNRLNVIVSKYNDRLNSILYNPNQLNLNEVHDVFDHDLKLTKKWEIEHLTNLIVTLKQFGKAKELNLHNYAMVIEAFDLYTYWEDQTTKGTRVCKKKALRMLDNIGASVPNSIIQRLAYNKDDSLRKLARAESFKINKSNTFKFMEDDFDKGFNHLDELRIHSGLISNAKKKTLPLFGRWIRTAKNEDFKCFLIREIAFFNQQESASYLMELYKTTDSVIVKSQIVITFGALKYEPAFTMLTDDYPYSSTPVQNAIVDVMGEYGSPEALDFLKNIYKSTHHDDKSFIKIIENIYKIDCQAKLIFKELRKYAASEFEKKAFSYVEYNSNFLGSRKKTKLS